MSGVHLWGFLRMRLSGRNPPCGETGFARALEERRALGSSTAPVPWFWVPRGPAGVASELPFLRVARCFPVVVAFREALPEATEWWLQQVVDPSYRGPRRVIRRAQWVSVQSSCFPGDPGGRRRVPRCGSGAAARGGDEGGCPVSCWESSAGLPF